MCNLPDQHGKCPTCGTVCAIHAGNEGTNSFVPMDVKRLEDENKRLREALEAARSKLE